MFLYAHTIVDEIINYIVGFGIWLILMGLLIIITIFAFFASVFFNEIARNWGQHFLFLSMALFVFYLLYSPETFGVELDDSAETSFGSACCGTIMFVIIPLSLVMRKYNYRKDRLEAEEKGLVWNDWSWAYVPTKELMSKGWNENWEWNDKRNDWDRNSPPKIHKINPEDLEPGTPVMVRYILNLHTENGDVSHEFDTEGTIIQKNDDGSYEVECHSSLWDKVDEKLRENVSAATTLEELQKDIYYKENLNVGDDEILILGSLLGFDYWDSLLVSGDLCPAVYVMNRGTDPPYCSGPYGTSGDGLFHQAKLIRKEEYGIVMDWSKAHTFPVKFALSLHDIIVALGGTPNVRDSEAESIEATNNGI